MKKILTTYWLALSILVLLSNCSKNNTPEKFIPDNAGMSVSAVNFGDLDSLDNFYRRIPVKANPTSLLAFLDSLGWRQVLKNQSVIFVPDRQSCLFMIDIGGVLSARQIVAQIENYSGNPIAVYNYKGFELFKAGTETPVYFTIVKDLLLMGNEAVLIETLLSENKHITKRNLDLSGQLEPFEFYIRPEGLTTLYSGLLSPGGKQFIQQLAGQYEFISLSTSGVTDFALEGFVGLKKTGISKRTGLSSEELLNIFQQSSRRSGQISIRKIDFELLESLDTSNYFSEYFLPWAGEEVGLFKTIKSDGLTTEGVLFKVKDKIQAANSLEQMKQQWTPGVPENYGMFTVFRMEIPDIIPLLGDESANAKLNYLVPLDNYMLIADSETFVKLFLEDIVAGNTMMGDEEMLEDIGLFNIGIAEINHLNSFFMANCFSDQRLKKGFSGLELSFLVSEGDALDSDVQVAVNIHNNSKQGNIAGQKVWSTRLSSAANTAPEIVGDRIFIQDVDNVLYCLNLSGDLLWETRLSGPILGQLQSVALAGEKVIFFNTPGEVIGLKMDGSFIAGFPRQCAAAATGQLTIVDFSHNQHYIFFVPSGDEIFAFDINGEPFVGWNPLIINGVVEHPLGHFQFRGEDYLYALDAIPSLRVFTKFGDPAFPAVELEGQCLSPPQHQSDPFEKLQGINRMVICNDMGKVKVVNPQGQHFNLRLPCGENDQTRFVFADIAGDERKDYVAASGSFVSLSAYDGLKFETRFEKQLATTISSVFSLENPCSEKDFIGAFSASGQQAYLLTSEGNVYSFFPLAATREFKLSFTEDCNTMTVIVVNSDEVYAVR
jgi:hypothetical protein